jgi:xylulokinase
MDKTRLLGIDIGSSSCKCSIVSADGQVLARAAVPYRTSTGAEGRSEQEPPVWYEAVKRALQRMESGSTERLRSIAACGVAGQMRGVVLLDEHGKSVRPAILWNDNRCTREVSELGSEHGELLRRITRNPLNTMCTLPKLRWLKNREHDSLSRARVMLYPKDYLVYRLTGSFGTDISDASGSSLFDLAEGTWSEEIAAAAGVSPDMLPPVHASYEKAGEVTRSAARELDLPEGIPVAAGASDATSEMFSLHMMDSSRCKVRLGSSGALSTVARELPAAGNQGYYLWAYLDHGAWMVDVNTRACASAVDWAAELLYGEAGPSAYRRMEEAARVVAPGAEGLFFHPYLSGEDAPYWDPTLTASVHGLRRMHGRGHIARAVYEGTAFALRDARTVISPYFSGFREYCITGGGSRNETWLQIAVDILDIEHGKVGAADASLGAALLGGVAGGLYRSPADAAARATSAGRSVRRDPGSARAYDLLFRRYKQLKEALGGA